MKSYPSIAGSRDHKVALGTPCLGFYKYDGSNLRWEWSKKQGWCKFGTRHRLFGHDEEPYNQAIPIFLNELAPSIEDIVRHEFKGLQKFIAFTEFFGPSSFAGNHELTEPKELVLIDVNIHPKGIIVPRLFLDLFGDQPYAPLLIYEGNLNQKLIEDVRSGIYPVEEGIVCKGADRRNTPWMVKIKTNAYLDKLKNRFGDDWVKYAE